MDMPVVTVSNDTNSSRVLSSNDSSSTNSSNSTNTSTPVSSYLNVTILGNINPYTNPEYTTDDIKALDQADLLVLLEGILGKDYTISAISSSVA